MVHEGLHVDVGEPLFSPSSHCSALALTAPSPQNLYVHHPPHDPLQHIDVGSQFDLATTVNSVIHDPVFITPITSLVLSGTDCALVIPLGQYGIGAGINTIISLLINIGLMGQRDDSSTQILVIDSVP